MKKEKRLIEFFIYPDAIGLDITGPLEVFWAATQILKQKGYASEGYETVFSAENTGLVRLSSGLQLYANISVGKGVPADMFLLPGGLGVGKITQNSKLIQKIRSTAKKAQQIISVCGGAFILAACGLLNGKKATTHWHVADDFANLFPEVNVHSDAIFICDGNVFTSAGVTAGIDLALALVEKHYGSSIATEVARMLVLYLRRPGGQSQFSAPLELRAKAGKRFADLYDWMLENLKHPLSVESLSDFVAMSPRHFSRVFTQKTGISPGKYIELLRLERARTFLESSNASLDEIAQESGFKREERLRRAFVRSFGITPSKYRSHFRSLSTSSGHDFSGALYPRRRHFLI